MGFLWIGAAAVLLFFLQEFLYQKGWDRGLSAQLFFVQEAVREGEQGELKEVIQNRKWMPLPVLHVNLQSDRSFQFFNQENTAVSDMVYRRDVFTLFPCQQVTRTLPFTATKRGYYPCKEVELVGFTLFFQGPFVTKQLQRAALYVYPKRIPMERVAATCQEMLGEYRQKKRLFEDPFAFKGIRNYEPGDSFRQINWKASGKTGQLMVNLYEHMAEEKVQIVLNLEGDSVWTDELLPESVIRIGAALAEQWIALGVPVGLWANRRDQLTGACTAIRPGAGAEHAKTLLQALSRIDLSEQRGTNFQVPRWAADIQGGLFLYVSLNCQNKEAEQLETLRQRGAEVLWIRPYTFKQEDEKRMGTKRPVFQDGTIYQGRVLEWRIAE